jgi:hypothetical protein
MSAERKIYWVVGIASLALLAASFLVPGERPERDELPWHIEHPTPDTTRVLGLTLGQSTPADAERRFREKGELGLFRSPEGRLSAEMFFEQINLAGLRSKVVLTVVVGEGELQAMHDRGARMSATASGKKITLSPDDESRLRGMPIGSLTLIPGVRVTEELLRKRFGEPAQVIKEANAEVFHHLYPQHALDATTSASKSEKQVLQFVSPKDYARLVEPLLKAGGQIISR